MFVCVCVCVCVCVYVCVCVCVCVCVQGGLVYGHYGSEADHLILQAKRVSLKSRIVLLRLGKLSLAEKVNICFQPLRKTLFLIYFFLTLSQQE